MKLEEGMYVRTEKGEIKKVFQYNEQEDNLIWCTLNCHATIKSSIVKSSKNIIDLIEENDILMYEYENKICISKVGLCGTIKMLKVSLDFQVSINCVKVLKILTKEQFESMAYEVEQ